MIQNWWHLIVSMGYFNHSFKLAQLKRKRLFRGRCWTVALPRTSKHEHWRQLGQRLIISHGQTSSDLDARRIVLLLKLSQIQATNCQCDQKRHTRATAIVSGKKLQHKTICFANLLSDTRHARCFAKPEIAMLRNCWETRLQFFGITWAHRPSMQNYTFLNLSTYQRCFH